MTNRGIDRADSHPYPNGTPPTNGATVRSIDRDRVVKSENGCDRPGTRGTGRDAFTWVVVDRTAVVQLR